MDSVIVIASLVHPFLAYPDPWAVGALGFQYQLLSVLELLCFQACLHSCLKFLGAVQWVVPSVVSWAVQRVVALSYPSIDTLFQIMEVVLKTDGNEGRSEGKSLVWKLLRANESLLSDANYARTFSKIVLSSCQRCLSSLLDLFKTAENYYYIVDEQISVEADNLLWLLDILVDRRAAEEFASLWANQQKLANMHSKTKTPSRHLVSCVTTRLFVGIGNGEILLAKDTRQLLLQTWFQPLVDDFSRLRELSSFDPEVVEENIERLILDLTPENQRSLLLAWYECFLKKGDKCPDLRKAFQGWCRRTFSKAPSHLSLLFK
ncbi:hypothetical protein MKW94_010631 [Papaver nudicaule]|uniref:At3g05675-like ankyrin-like domain-containing protein n=1 Tax=Papaver nudicaule TaxID=74823 RepID=A0AA42AX65_PAPNU|nr:hypothetical protein [Papaver nudicaule]